MYVQVPQWADDWAVCAVDIPDAKCHWYVIAPDNTFGDLMGNAPWFDANGLNDAAPMQASTVVEKLQNGNQKIEVNQVNIPQVFVPNWQTQHPNVDHLVPLYFTDQSIVDMPGCVKAHQDNQYHVTGLPKDKNLVEKDPDKQ